MDKSLSERITTMALRHNVLSFDASGSLTLEKASEIIPAASALAKASYRRAVIRGVIKLR